MQQPLRNGMIGNPALPTLCLDNGLALAIRGLPLFIRRPCALAHRKIRAV
jgi:hypothetical protein